MYVVIMLVSFGVPLIGVGASFWQSRQATQASQNAAAQAVARVTGATKTPEAPTQVVPRTSRSALTAPSAPSADAGEPTTDPADSPARPAGEGTSLDGFQKLKGCSCRAKAGPVELHLRASSGGTIITGSGTRRAVQLSFAAKAGGGTPFTLPTTSETAPANEYTRGRFPLGMGCGGDTLVIATEDSVTGWSLSKRTAQWTQTLPGSYGDVRPGDTPSLDCKSLSVGGGAVTVRAGGKTVRLDLESGEPASNKGSSKPSSSSSKPSPAPTPPDSDPTPAEPKPADTKPKPKPAPEPEPETDAKKKKAKKKKKGKKKKRKKGKKK